MKKKHADYSKIKDILEKEFKKLDTKNDPEFGTVCLLNAKKVEKKWRVPRENGEEVILDMGYRWLTLYPRDENYAIIAVFNSKSELVEFYFDIAKKVKYKARVPYIIDLYLDVVFTKENDVIFLDEDELEEAFKLLDIKQKDYELAKKTADKIVNRYHNQEEFDKLKEIASNYLDKLMMQAE